MVFRLVGTGRAAVVEPEGLVGDGHPRCTSYRLILVDGLGLARVVVDSALVVAGRVDVEACGEFDVLLPHGGG